MGKLFATIEADCRELSDDRSWANLLRKRYHLLMKQNPEMADEYDVADAQEILAEYLFPVYPNRHIFWLTKVISFVALLLFETLLSILLAGLLIQIIFPNVTGNTHGWLAIGAILAVGIPLDIIYIRHREDAHRQIVSRRVKKLRNWLAKTRV